MALVVGSPDIDDAIVATLQKLVVMVGDVRGEVGRLATTSNQNVVLVLAQAGGHEPGSALPLGKVALLAQKLHSRLIVAGVKEALFAKPDIELHLNGLKVISNGLEHLLQADLPYGRNRLIFRHVAGRIQETASLLTKHLLGQLLHVAAHVAALWHHSILTQRLEVADVEGAIEGVYLGPGVVDVVLPGDFVTRGGHDAGQAAAQHRAPGVAHVDGARWIDADELDLDPPPAADVQACIPVALLEDRIDLLTQPLPADGEVDETGSRHRHLLDKLLGRDEGRQPFGDGHGAHAGRTGET